MAALKKSRPIAVGLVVGLAQAALDAGRPLGPHGSIAKTYAFEAAVKVTNDALQIFGGYGYSREYPVEKMVRDARIYTIFEGTNQIQRDIIAGNLIPRRK